MKADLHPALNSVAFVDVSTGHKFLTQSTMRGSKTEIIDGNEYQVVICDITADSHPAFYSFPSVSQHGWPARRLVRHFLAISVQGQFY